MCTSTLCGSGGDVSFARLDVDLELARCDGAQRREAHRTDVAVAELDLHVELRSSNHAPHLLRRAPEHLEPGGAEPKHRELVRRPGEGEPGDHRAAPGERCGKAEHHARGDGRQRSECDVNGRSGREELHEAGLSVTPAEPRAGSRRARPLR